VRFLVDVPTLFALADGQGYDQVTRVKSVHMKIKTDQDCLAASRKFNCALKTVRTPYLLKPRCTSFSVAPIPQNRGISYFVYRRCLAQRLLHNNLFLTLAV
jgi:hypothetical protein